MYIIVNNEVKEDVLFKKLSENIEKPEIKNWAERLSDFIPDFRKFFK